MDHDRKMTLGLVSRAWLTYIYIALREAACVLSFPAFHMINLGRSHAGIRGPRLVRRLSSANSALKLSIWLLISYLDILALS